MSKTVRGATGRYETTSVVGGERVKAFIPAPLPPDPPLRIDAALRDKLDAALLALGRLDSVTMLLPDTHLFLYTYVRKEAVLSSQIEGTQSSLSELLMFEASDAPGIPMDDVVEVSNYVAALEHGLRRIREGFPLSNRLLREIHGVLLSRGRGRAKQPGDFRTSQNWLGGTRPGNAAFVPPPPQYVAECMGSLEKWLHDQPERTPSLLKAALAHVQFETIHPFLHGNGRLGRLMVTLLLCAEGVLSEPLLYQSLYLKKNRDSYYGWLDRVRTRGDWEGWVGFFADGVTETAGGAVTTAQRLVKLFQRDHGRIQELGRSASSALRVHNALRARPIGSIAQIAHVSGISVPSVTNSLMSLGELKIAHEITGRRRNRLFGYPAYLRILEEGTEPLAR